MKKSFLLKSVITLLLAFVVVFAAVSCKEGDDKGDGNNGVVTDKSALSAELASEVSAQGDYTADSYNAYLAKLAEAKQIAADAAATQEAIDKAAADLTAARSALAIRPITAVKGANKEFSMLSGTNKEIVIADYVNLNGLSKITYKLQASNDLVTLSPVADGKFTISAGEVNGEAVVKVSINVYYDNAAKLSVELSVKVTNDVSPTVFDLEFVKEYDVVTLGNKDSIVIDFAENVNNYGNLELNYAAKCGDDVLTLDGSSYIFALGTYTEEITYKSFTVTVSYVANGEAKTLEYTYKLGLKNTGKYNVINGSFENGLDGWTLTNTVGTVPFGGIDSKTIYWVQEFPMNNVGSYFSAYADGVSEESQGTLASSYFTVNSDYATYMLGGAGNPNVYITIEDKNGNVLALYRNTKFADIPEGVTDFDAQRELIGKTIFLANFVTYKVNISAFKGEEVRFVVHDHASSGWGVVFFDELNTYYTSADTIPEGAVLAENLLADKAALNAQIAQEITEQGDYTLGSYNAYLAKLQEAKDIVNDVAVTQATVDAAASELSAARSALAVRPVETVEGANKTLKLVSGNSTEVVISDYVNSNGLSKITYEIKANSAVVTLGSVADGKFTVTAGSVSEETVVKVTVTVCYDGVAKLEVELCVRVTNDSAPTVLNEEIVKAYDVFTLANKEGIILDLSENVDNLGNLELTYSVAGTALTNSLYTFTFGDYTEEVTNESFTVTVSYEANGEKGSIQYVYKLAMKDTTSYRLVNGGFENGMDGWAVVGNIGNVSTDKNYWLNDPERAEGFEFGMDGDKMFSAYAIGAKESAVGTLTSSTFKVGGSGFITFKVGAMRDCNYVYIDVVDAATKQILARYYNGLWSERTDGVKSGCTLIAYKANLSEFIGREVFFRISDNADSGYGLFFADSFITYYETEPEGFNNAVSPDYKLPGTIYDVFNGGFEMGDVQGWWNNGEPGAVTGADEFFNSTSYGKDGNFLYSGVEDSVDGNNVGNGREGNTGILTSSVFEIGGSGYISYMLGGGNDYCYVQIIDSTTCEILARYRQQAREDGVLKAYVADLSAYIGRSVRIQLVDSAVNDWGCVSFDNVVTYHVSKPAGIDAVDVKSELSNIANGSFESGINGWIMNITDAVDHNTLGWVLETEIDAEWYTKNDDRKDGNNLFTFVKPDDTNAEKCKGTLTSSTFILKKNSFVSFRFGAAGGAGQSIGGVNHDVYIQLCKANGDVIATFYNDHPDKLNTAMNAYSYQYTGEDAQCFFRIVDNSNGEGGYGCFVVDDFKVNLESKPDGFIDAIQPIEE